jgi:polyferredoxin
VNAYTLAADAVLLVHALFVAFVVIGQALILAGLWRGWRWVRNFRFRVTHLAAIGIVVAQGWLGVLCPLTVLENVLRRRAGQAPYAHSFIGHWLQRIIFYEAEAWVFTALYTAFGALVVLTWIYGRPVR